MNRTFAVFTTVASFALSLSLASPASAATSAADRAFVAMVSQGGAFETAAGKIAATHAHAQDVVDQGVTEAHDHAIVGARLHAAAARAGIPIAAGLNAMFRAKLDALTPLSGAAFDNAFLADMQAVHAKDGAAFAKEAAGGTNPALRRFAAETHRIVLRHIGSLQAVGPETP